MAMLRPGYASGWKYPPIVVLGLLLAGASGASERDWWRNQVESAPPHDTPGWRAADDPAAPGGWTTPGYGERWPEPRDSRPGVDRGNPWALPPQRYDGGASGRRPWGELPAEGRGRRAETGQWGYRFPPPGNGPPVYRNDRNDTRPRYDWAPTPPGYGPYGYAHPYPGGWGYPDGIAFPGLWGGGPDWAPAFGSPWGRW